MKEPKAIKISQLTSGVIFLVVGILMAIIFLLMSALVEPIILLWIGLPLFFIIFIEVGLYWASESIKIDEEKFRMKQENIASQVGHSIALYYKYSSLVKNIFSFFLFIAILGLFGYLVLKNVKIEPLIHSTIFYVQLATYGSYFLIIRPLIRKFFGGAKNPVKKWNKKIIPDYVLQPDGLILNLYYSQGKAGIILIIGFLLGIIIPVTIPMETKYKIIILSGVFVWTIIFAVILKGHTKQYPVKIKFDEINEIKEFSYVETDSLLKYEIGPDIDLQMRATGDLMKFLRGDIPRPMTFFLSPASGARTLLIKGDEIFYLTPVSNGDCKDLIQSFKKFKAKGK